MIKLLNLNWRSLPIILWLLNWIRLSINFQPRITHNWKLFDWVLKILLSFYIPWLWHSGLGIKASLFLHSIKLWHKKCFQKTIQLTDLKSNPSQIKNRYIPFFLYISLIHWLKQEPECNQNPIAWDKQTCLAKDQFSQLLKLILLLRSTVNAIALTIRKDETVKSV